MTTQPPLMQLSLGEITARKIAFVLPELHLEAVPVKDENYVGFHIPRFISSGGRREPYPVQHVIEGLIKGGILDKGNLIGVSFEDQSTPDSYKEETGGQTRNEADSLVPETRTVHYTRHEEVMKLVPPKNRRKPDVYVEEGTCPGKEGTPTTLHISFACINDHMLDKVFSFLLGNDGGQHSELFGKKFYHRGEGNILKLAGEAAEPVKGLVKKAQDTCLDLEDMISGDARSQANEFASSCEEFVKSCDEVCGNSGISQIMPPADFRRLVVKSRYLNL